MCLFEIWINLIIVLVRIIFIVKVRFLNDKKEKKRSGKLKENVVK